MIKLTRSSYSQTETPFGSVIFHFQSFNKLYIHVHLPKIITLTKKSPLPPPAVILNVLLIFTTSNSFRFLLQVDLVKTDTNLYKKEKIRKLFHIHGCFNPFKAAVPNLELKKWRQLQIKASYRFYLQTIYLQSYIFFKFLYTQ